MEHPLSVQQIMQMIFVVRGLRVIFDSDLAVLYGVETKNLNKAVRRNIGRFPEDFMFQLSPEEFEILRFQIGTSSSGLKLICALWTCAVPPPLVRVNPY